MVAIAEPRRSFRLHVARKFSFACLLDIYDAFCGWPSNETFLSKTLDPNESTCSLEQQRRWLRGLYNQLSQIFHRVEIAVGSSGITRSADGFTPNVGVKKSNKTTLFPFLQRSTLKLLFRHKTQERDEHPICRDLQGTSASDVTKFVQFCKKQRQALLPVQDDLQIRIAYRLLPVRSRFWFLAHQISNVQQCPYNGCAAIETAQHLFLGCHNSNEIWKALWKDWSIFFVGGIHWTSMVLPHKQEIRSTWSHHREAVLCLWNIVRCAALHRQWTERNKVCFEDGGPEPLETAISTIYSTFSSNYRRFLRLSNFENQAKFNSLLQRLQYSKRLGDFMSRHGNRFKLRHVQLHLTSRSGVVFRTVVEY